MPASAIRDLDNSRFDKKGIVYLKYDLSAGDVIAGSMADGAGVGTITLDDFVYDQEPTDQIIDRIEAVVAPPAGDDEPSEGVVDRGGRRGSRDRPDGWGTRMLIGQQFRERLVRIRCPVYDPRCRHGEEIQPTSIAASYDVCPTSCPSP